MTNTVSINKIGKGQWKMKTEKGIEPWKQTTLTQTGFGGEMEVHQNITHAVNPDPISGAHCWLQKSKYF